MRALYLKVILIASTLLASCASKEIPKDKNTRIFVYNITTNKFELPNGRNLDNPNLISYDVTETTWKDYTDKDSLEILNSHKVVR